MAGDRAADATRLRFGKRGELSPVHLQNLGKIAAIADGDAQFADKAVRIDRGATGGCQTATVDRSPTICGQSVAADHGAASHCQAITADCRTTAKRRATTAN